MGRLCDAHILTCYASFASYWYLVQTQVATHFRGSGADAPLVHKEGQEGRSRGLVYRQPGCRVGVKSEDWLRRWGQVKVGRYQQTCD